MMKRSWLTIGFFCLLVLSFGQAHADLHVTAISPEATDGAITLADADSFHVDIWMYIDQGDPDLTGGKIALGFYSPDNSVTNLQHLAVPASLIYPISTNSVEYLNGFTTKFAFLQLPYENGWGDGSLPDSIAIDFAGLTGIMPSDPNQAYIRFNLRVANDGLLCIEELNAEGTEFDWLFDRPFTFETTCWTIGDYAPDNPPEITCPADIEVECGGSTDPSATGNPVVTDDNDPSPTVGYSDSFSAGTCPNIMVITRTWTATDDKNQTSSCTQTITVADKTAPEFTTCPGNFTVQCEGDIDPSITGYAYANDACDEAPEVTYSDGAITAGSFVRTWTATDACGNFTTCDQTITIDDTTPPTITCPGDITVDNDPGECFAVVTFSATASDNCGTVDVVYEPASGSTFNLGTTLVTVTATDASNNTNSCTFNVIVNDAEAPIITCPDPVTLECGADINDPANTGTATASDLCDAEVDITYLDGDPLDGVVTRTWTATDDYGNFTTCDQLITLAVDDEAPVFTSECPADVMVECDAIPNPAEMTATDNCIGVTITFTENITPGSCENAYTITRTWVAEDNSGNTTQCVQTITVIDSTNPELVSCPDDIILTCGASTDPNNTGMPVATDNCAEPTYNYTDGDPVEGVFIRTWTISDGCGNSIECSQTITVVEDTEAPSFDQECPADVTVECNDVPEPPTMTATDNCDGAVEVIFSEDVIAGDCVNGYTITRTWEASDGLTNTNTCVQVITVVDTQPPILTCPDNITVGYGMSTDPDATGYATATDNCTADPNVTYSDGEVVDRTFTRTWSAEDECGNTNTCGQIITEADMGDPFLTANPESFFFDVTEYDYVANNILNIGERFDRQVQISATSNQPWLIITSSFPVATPNVIFFDIDATTILYGDYTATISVTSAEAQNSPLEIPVSLHVDPFIAPPDSVWVSTVPAVPGGKAVVPVYFKNNDPLTKVNVPMEWSMPGLMLDSVSFAGTRVAYINGYEKGYSYSNTLRQVQITVDPTFSPNIPGGRGLLAFMYFTVDEMVTTPSFIALNATIIPPEGFVYFLDEEGEENIPIYTPGGVVIDDQEAFVCGSVVEMINGIKTPVPGATVEFWDDFPVGALQTTETTDGNGQFACGTLGIVPFDAYAFKEGYYPGTVSGIDFGTLGVEIMLTRVSDVAYSTIWVQYFSGERLGGCQSYFYNIPLPIGSVIDAYAVGDPMVHCGTDFVDFPGEYIMPVYGDNPETPEKDGAWEGDEIVFYVNGYPAATEAPVIWSESDLSVEVCFDLNAVSMKSIELNAGMNLISWNIDTPSDDIEDLFADIMPNVAAVLGFESGGFTYDPVYPEFSTLLSVDHLHGYWVDMAEPDVLVLEGSPVAPATPIDLENEWNLVSYLPNTAYEPAFALDDIIDQLDLVYGWVDGAPLDYETDLPEYATLEMMETGFGYWLYMNSPATLNYPGSGPEVLFNQGPAKFNMPVVQSNIKTSRYWTNIFSTGLTLDGMTIPKGTEIVAMSADGRAVGSGIVQADGKFGFVPVYGDDPLTEVNEGLQTGESFSLVVDGVKTAEQIIWNSDSHRIEINDLTTAKSNGGLLPNEFGLSQNYPNPFNPTTSISFSVPTATNVTLEIFNILGEKVATPFAGIAKAGINEVTWDGNNDAGQTVASGIYFYRMSADNFEQTRKMVLMK